jgi:hypothetical protein
MITSWQWTQDLPRTFSISDQMENGKLDDPEHNGMATFEKELTKNVYIQVDCNDVDDNNDDDDNDDYDDDDGNDILIANFTK